MSSTAPPASGAGGALVVATVAGACTLVLELSAVRLLAPWFGTSATVWTNVIGVVLLALSIGYLLGARLARGARPRRSLGLALAGAALCSAWLPLLVAPLAGLFRPAGLRLDEALALLTWGSLASALALFLLPAAFLGAVGPLALELVQRAQGGHAGTAGGRVLCVSTLGSLAGSFACTHLLVPRVGLSTSYLLVAFALAACATALLVAERRGLAALAALLALAPAAWLGGRRSPALPEGVRLLEQRETPYQLARVVEEGEGAERMRRLVVDEGLDSFQSVWVPEPGLLPPGYYYDLFALPPCLDGPRERWRVFVMGLGAGTAFRVLEGALPAGEELVAAGAELDPVVTALGARWMELAHDPPRRRVLAGWDARAALRVLEPGWDEIVLDAYAHQVEIPPHLATLELFGEVREALRPGGWLCVNVGAFGLDDPVLLALAATAARAFGQPCLALRVPFARNVIVLARRDEPVPAVDAERLVACAFPRGLAEALALPGASRSIGADAGALLLDDRSALELLQRESIAEAARRLRASVP